MSALVLATGDQNLLLGTTEDTRTAFQSEPIFHHLIFNIPEYFVRSFYTTVKCLEACQHQIDLIPRRPIHSVLRVLELELILFMVTSFPLNKRMSPKSGRTPLNSGLLGLTPPA